MIVIQIIIIICAILILRSGLRGRKTHMGRAWKKLGLSLLIAGMVVAVIYPNSTNTLAHWVGVGRGADLLLYGLTLAFIGYALNNYLQQQDEKDALYRLARKVSLLDANGRYKIDTE